MPLTFSCSGCGANLKLAKAPAAGARIKCPKCGAAVAVPMEDARPAPAEAAALRQSTAPRVDTASDDDYGDEDRTRPRGKKKFKKKQQASSNGLLIGVCVGVGVLVLGVVATLAIVLLTRDKPDVNLAQNTVANNPAPRQTPPPQPPAGNFTPPTRPSNPPDRPAPSNPGQPPAPPAKPPEERKPAEPPVASKPPESDKPAGDLANKPPDSPPSSPPADTPPEDTTPPEVGFEIGNLAPEILGADIDGKKFKLSDYRGKVVVLDFWGHW